MHPLFFLMPVVLAYVVFRSVSHYRAKRWPFLIATIFIAAVLVFEILFQLTQHFTSGS